MQVVLNSVQKIALKKNYPQLGLGVWVTVRTGVGWEQSSSGAIVLEQS